MTYETLVPLESPRRLSSAMVVVVVALALLAAILGLPTTAHGAQITTINSRQPQPNSTIGANIPLIVQATATPVSPPLDPATRRLYLDGALISTYNFSLNTYASYQTIYLYYDWTRTPPFSSDGPHTVRFEITDTAGTMSVLTWSWNVAQPPTATWLAPAAGVTVYSGSPQIQINLADNTPATAFTVTGAARTGSATGPIVATFGGVGLPAGAATFGLSNELPVGTVYLTATVRDALGNVQTMAPRSFVTASAPVMTIQPGCLAAGCHVNTGHPVGANCASCHVGGYEHDGWWEGPDCSPCHDPHPGPETVTWMPCTDCHTSAYPTVPQHTTAEIQAAHASSCEGCHAVSLIAQHAVTPEGSAYTNQCGLCHATQNALVTGAVVTGTATAGATACSACHEGHADAHATVFDAECVTCHTGDLPELHPTLDCAGCHALPLHDGATCTGCHDDKTPTNHGDYTAAHLAAWEPECANQCHGADLVETHAGNCDTCHAGGAMPAAGTTCFDCHVTYHDKATSTPASSPWTLALVAVAGLAAVPVIRRTRTV